MKFLSPQDVRAAIAASAQKANAEYPQHQGHWEGAEWRLARMLDDVAGSLGRLRREQLVIARTNMQVSQPNPLGPMVTVWAQDGNIDMVIPVTAIEWLEPVRQTDDDPELFAEQVLECVERLNGFLPTLARIYDDPLVLLAALAEHVGGGMRVLVEQRLCSAPQAEKVLQHIRDTALDPAYSDVSVSFHVPLGQHPKPRRARRRR